MRNGWTGGQYSLFRILFGLGVALYVALHPWPGPARWLALAAAVPFVIGLRDRAAAAILAAVFGWKMATAGVLDLASLVTVWILVAHVVLPAAPFGSWSARRRLDPGGGWTFPSWLLRIHRGVLAAAVLAIVLGVEAPTLALLPLLLLSLDPAWLSGRDAHAAPALVLYDGTCGFCHASIRVLLAEDADGRRFHFAPLESDRARAAVTEAVRREVGDAIIVRTPDGRVLTRSAAVSYIGARLGGVWRLAAALLAGWPVRWRDAAYDAVARVRHRLAARPKEACPILPAHLRERFES